MIAVGFVQFVFFIGMLSQKLKSKGEKVETHDTRLTDFENKVDKIAGQVNLIENESTSHKENIHRMRNDLNSFIALTNQRFERIDKNQTVQMMLLFELCQKQGINTKMAESLMKE